MATRLLLVSVLFIQARIISTLTFRDSPANNTVLSTLAADATLHCAATSPAPPFLVSWKHNDAFVNTSDRTSTRYNQSTGQSALTISGGATYSDAGAYQCVAFDAQGNVLAISSIGFLTVIGPPLLLSTLLNLIVPLGGYAIFAAPSAFSNPPYSSTAWYNGTAAIQSSGRVSITSSALTISNVQATDAGIYEYTVTNRYGTINAYGSLAIGQSVDSMVRVLVGLNKTAAMSYVLREGDQLILLCSYSLGSNLFGVTWTKDLAMLTSHLTVGSGGLSYTLGAVNRSDAGLYLCSAQKPQGGVTQASILIDVQYAPYFTAIPASRTINSSTILQNMQCQATSNPGPPTIAWWGPNGQVLGVSGGSPVLGPLSGRDSGVYTCVATNFVGTSTAGVSITVLAASVVISPSHDYTAFENNASIFTFNCSGNGTSLVWTVDGYSTGSSYALNKGIQATRFIVSPDRLTVSSQLIVPTTKANKNITVICTVQDSLFNHQSSNPVKLFLQGILPPPQQFQVNISNSTVNLSWIAPYSLQVSTPPTISYYALSNNLTNSTKTFNNPTTCNPLASCNYSLDLRDPFFITIGSSGKNKEETILEYNGTMEFTFFAVNGAGNGNAATITYMSTKRNQADFQIKLLTTNTAAIIMATPTITIMDYSNQTREISSTIIYGTICGVSAIMVSTVVGVVSVYVCIRCKHKGKMENTRIEMEENNAYQGIKKLTSSLTGEDMEPCPAYGIVL